MHQAERLKHGKQFSDSQAWQIINSWLDTEVGQLFSKHNSNLEKLIAIEAKRFKRNWYAENYKTVEYS